MNPEIRESALFNFYRAERLSGATPVEANERMGEYAKRLDALYEQQHAAVTLEMENAS